MITKNNIAILILFCTFSLTAMNYKKECAKKCLHGDKKYFISYLSGPSSTHHQILLAQQAYKDCHNRCIVGEYKPQDKDVCKGYYPGKWPQPKEWEYCLAKYTLENEE